MSQEKETGVGLPVSIRTASTLVQGQNLKTATYEAFRRSLLSKQRSSNRGVGAPAAPFFKTVSSRQGTVFY